MVYSNGFVVSVIHNGNVLEENRASEVKLPLGSEYSIRLRNKNNRRAVAVISIDDENVSGGGYIINANSYVDIERFANVSKRFKFVSENSYAAKKAGKGPREDRANGIISVSFKLEVESPKMTYYPPATIKPWIVPSPYNKDTNRWTKPEIKPEIWMWEDTQSITYNCGGEPTSPIRSAGVTVEGGHSKQAFKYEYFDADSLETVVVVHLTPGQVKKSIAYCAKCGKKAQPRDNFCSKCGRKLG